MPSRKPIPGQLPLLQVVQGRASTDRWLEELARSGCADSTLDFYAKSLVWAERRLGCELADAGPDEWARFAASGVRFDKPRLRLLRRYLAWAGRPIPEEIRDGTDGTAGRPGPAPKRRRMNPSWKQPIDEWMTWVASGSVAASTLELRRRQILMVAEHFHPLGPWEVTPNRMAGYLGGQGWSRETMRSARGALRSFYGFHHAAGTIATDPSRLLRKIPARLYQPRPADDDTIGDALARADSRVYLMLMLAARCGLRCVEISRLHTDDLERSPAGWWTLAVLGKGDRRRTVPVMDDIAAAIRELPRGYVFPNGQGGYLSRHYVGKLISQSLPDGITAHMLRHRYASTSYALTHDLRAVQVLLGHSSPAVTQVYVKISDQQVYDAAAAASRINVNSAPTVPRGTAAVSATARIVVSERDSDPACQATRNARDPMTAGCCWVPCSERRRHNYDETDRDGNPVTLHSWTPTGSEHASILTAETLTPDGIVYSAPVIVLVDVDTTDFTPAAALALADEIRTCVEHLAAWQPSSAG